jgi:hypothetical protein
VAPTRPARVDDDAVMTSVTRLPLNNDPFTFIYDMFVADTGVKKDNPQYTTLYTEWFLKNSHRVAAPSADRNV